MEIFFVGSLIVALMIYASTKIKKSVARAFESEIVETDEFIIDKPEGFLSVIDDESKFAFEAYSKDFGTGDADGTRQARVYINAFSGANFTERCAETKKNAGEILTEEINENVCLIKSEENREEFPAYNFYKIVAGKTNRKIYELKISVLQNYLNDFQTRVDELLKSFRLK
jgi:hypothetical protein